MPSHSFILLFLTFLLGLSRCQEPTNSSAASSSSSSSSSPSSSSSSSPALPVSVDGSCGDGTTFVCLGSRWGDCCSAKGWCGKDSNYCGTGCQNSFGNCSATSSPSSSNRNSTESISTDGSCGGSTGSTCLGSEFGDCCSEKGYCGGNGSYCAAGCQSDFGVCGSADSTTDKISVDGSCGGSTGSICLGSTFGDCCSAKGWCGGNSSYCDAGCQTDFGTCSSALASNSSATSSPNPTSADALATSPANSSAASLPIPTVETTGFKVGVGVSSAVALVALVALVYFLLRRRRHRTNAPKVMGDIVEAPAENPASFSPSVPGSVPSTVSPTMEKVYPSELSTVAYHQELPATAGRDRPRRGELSVSK